MQDAVADLLHKQVTLTLRLHELNKVTVAALPGAAAGAGFSMALACDLQVASSNAFVTTKINLNQGMDQTLRQSLVLEAEHLIASIRDPEAREAISAFMEKRKPTFHGEKPG